MINREPTKEEIAEDEAVSEMWNKYSWLGIENGIETGNMIAYLT
jgi:hypothetical protein